VDEARVERGWRDLVETGTAMADFDDRETGEAWRAALRCRARRLGRRILTLRPSHDPLRCWAHLADWHTASPEDEQEARSRRFIDAIDLKREWPGRSSSSRRRRSSPTSAPPNEKSSTPSAVNRCGRPAGDDRVRRDQTFQTFTPLG
jgi:hypothetical protein